MNGIGEFVVEKKGLDEGVADANSGLMKAFEDFAGVGEGIVMWV